MHRASHEAFMQVERLETGLYWIDYQGWDIHIKYVDRGQATNLFGFHAGVARRMPGVPVFVGGTIAPQLPANEIAFSDPVPQASAKLALGWFCGARTLPLQALLAGYIERIQAITGARRPVFWGSSGGGFAALYFASRFAEASTVVFNPQIDLRVRSGCQAGVAGTAMFEAYLGNAFGLSPRQIDGHPMAPVLDVREVLPADPSRHIVYVQNTGDDFHVETQMRPFLAHFDTPPAPGPARAGLNLWCQHWGEGHVVVPKAVYHEALRQAC